MSKIIAVSGAMASGKNMFSSVMEALGYVTSDSDLLVHDAINKNSTLILETFLPYAHKLGINIQNEDGSLNRKNLGKLLFSNKKFLQMQENIVYPYVISETEKAISDCKGKDFVINATVLYKTPELLKKCSTVIFVKAPLYKRFKRAKKRDRMKSTLILQRFWAQRNLLHEYKKTGVPVVIFKNNGTLHDFEENVKFFLKKEKL